MTVMCESFFATLECELLDRVSTCDDTERSASHPASALPVMSTRRSSP